MVAVALLAGCAATTPPEEPPELIPATVFNAEALPADADRSDPEAQRRLWARGLYRTQDDEVRALPPDWQDVRFTPPDVEAPPPERAPPQTDGRIEIVLEEPSD